MADKEKEVVWQLPAIIGGIVLSLIVIGGLATGAYFLNKHMKKKQKENAAKAAEKAAAKKKADAEKAKAAKVYITVPEQRIEVKGLSAGSLPTKSKATTTAKSVKPKKTKIEQLVPLLSLIGVLTPILSYILIRLRVMGKELFDVMAVLMKSLGDGKLTKEEMKAIGKETKEFFKAAKDTFTGLEKKGVISTKSPNSVLSLGSVGKSAQKML